MKNIGRRYTIYRKIIQKEEKKDNRLLEVGLIADNSTEVRPFTIDET